jgi:hypothetical protein
MASFIAKMNKQTYANIRFLKQVLGISNDEQLLELMAYSSAAETNAQLQQIKAQAEKPTEEGESNDIPKDTDKE